MIFYGSSISASLAHENLINIETSISEKGLPTFEIYGLINKSIEESKKRIINAFESVGTSFPLRNITINLSPAEFHKDGTHFDLAIAVSILKYTNSLEYDEKKELFLGELGFDGSIKGVKNITFLVLVARSIGFRKIFVPYENYPQLLKIKDIQIVPLKNLREVVSCNFNLTVLEEQENYTDIAPPRSFSKILGNSKNKKILSYALSGKHHTLIRGFPGSGKSLLAKSAEDLMPDLTIPQAYEVAKIFSYLSISREVSDFSKAPFRSPHNSSSYSSIFGSCSHNVTPGEVSIANYGVLFLDEFPEFNRQVLEGLRAPLEDKQITISRAKIKKTLPTDFILIATMNPCKCGYFNHKKIECSCAPIEIKRYRNRISGPILDRIDIILDYDGQINNFDYKEENNYSYVEFQNLKRRITETRKLLEDLKADLSTNPVLESKDKKVVHNFCSDSTLKVLNSLQEKYSISNRRYFKILNLALTIAFFNNEDIVSEDRIFESISLTGFKL